MRLRYTITSFALSPTGAFKHASEFFIASKVSSGNAFPVFFKTVSPASSFVIYNGREKLSLIASKILSADSDISGPIPSPVTNEMLYL